MGPHRMIVAATCRLWPCLGFASGVESESHFVSVRLDGRAGEAGQLRLDVTDWWETLLPESSSHREMIMDALEKTTDVLRYLYDLLREVQESSGSEESCFSRRLKVLTTISSYQNVVASAQHFLETNSECAWGPSASSCGSTPKETSDDQSRIPSPTLGWRGGGVKFGGQSHGPADVVQRWISELGRVLFSHAWTEEMRCEAGTDTSIFVTLEAMVQIQQVWPWIVDVAAIASAAGVEVAVPLLEHRRQGDGAILVQLLSALPQDAPLIVEIGVDAGLTSMYLLESIQGLRLVGVDPYHGVYAGVPSWHRSDRMGASSRYELATSNYARFHTRAELKRLPSARVAQNWTLGPIDLVFIDGEHDYGSCWQDIDVWSPLVRRGGIVAGDDYQSGQPGVLKAVHEKLPKGTRLHVAPGGVWWWVKF